MTVIVPFTPDMAEACATLMHEAVHEGAAKHYTLAERNAWSLRPMPHDDFARRVSDQIALTAWQADRLVGFMTMQTDGHLDLAYVAPRVRGSGVADRLLADLVHEAHARGLHHLTTHASRPARSFFRRHGWSVIRPEITLRAGVRLENFVMSFDT